MGSLEKNQICYQGCSCIHACIVEGFARPLQNEDDWVREEILYAIEHQKKSYQLTPTKRLTVYMKRYPKLSVALQISRIQKSISAKHWELPLT